jgi:murein DD-endopeptidase MepM/ murein hydrolase activator NlpD
MKRRYYAGLVLTAVMLLIPVLFFSCTGPRDTSVFPPAADSPYLLPWPEGIRYLCVQGVRGIVSHRGDSEFAYDFYMPVGSDICAARAGEVVRVVTEHDGHGYKWPNNLVIVQHDDGTRACYAHIKQEGSYVAEGDQIEQGQVIAASGNVGNSMMPHLHFHVTDPALKRTIPITFADVKKDLGIPRMFKWYTSGNQ